MELPSFNPAGRATQTPIFEKIGIVGLGLIGGSIALAARQIWPTSLVIGVDNKDVLETAMRLHAIDVAADDLDRAGRSRPGDPRRAGAAEHRAARRARRERPAAGGRHRHRQHQARDRRRRARRCRRGSPSSAAIRSAARRSAGSSTRVPISSRGGPGCSRRPATAAATRSRSCSRSPARSARVPRIVERRRTRPAAGVSQPSAAADRERPDAGGRRGGGRGRPGARRPRPRRHDAPGRRVPPRSGRTSPPPTPTRSARRSTRLIALLQELRARSAGRRSARGGLRRADHWRQSLPK